MIEEVFSLIREECTTQDKKWKHQPPTSISDWLTLLLNELGRVAGEAARGWPSAQAALDGFVRVAAIAVAAAVALLAVVKEIESEQVDGPPF